MSVHRRAPQSGQLVTQEMPPVTKRTAVPASVASPTAIAPLRLRSTTITALTNAAQSR